MYVTREQAIKWLAAYNSKRGQPPVHWCGSDTLEDIRQVCDMADPEIWPKMLASLRSKTKQARLAAA